MSPVDTIVAELREKGEVRIPDPCNEHGAYHLAALQGGGPIGVAYLSPDLDVGICIAWQNPPTLIRGHVDRFTFNAAALIAVICAGLPLNELRCGHRLPARYV